MNGWFLAKIVEENTIENDSENIVFVNYVLIEANSPREALEIAIALGKENQLSYLNSEQKLVMSNFRGLAGLTYISDTLIDGTKVGILNKEASNLDELVTEREDLAIFQIQGDIDYTQVHTKFVSKDILDKLHARDNDISVYSSDTKMQLSWFLVEIVLEENSTPFIVQMIFKPTASQDVYSRAIELGILQAESSGSIFHGLHDIYEIGTELTHGSEIVFEEYLNLDEDEIKTMLVDEEDLEVFQQS